MSGSAKSISAMQRYFEDLQAERSDRYSEKKPCLGRLPSYFEGTREDIERDLVIIERMERQRTARARKAINDFVKESARYFDVHGTIVGMPLTKAEIAAYTGRRS